MLRKTIQMNIINALKNGNFTQDDFEIDFSGSYLAEIRFASLKEYSFIINKNERFDKTKVSSNDGNPFLGLMSGLPTKKTEKEIQELKSQYDLYVCPGEEEHSETWYKYDLVNIENDISDWLTNIHQELSVASFEREPSTEKEKIKKVLEEGLKSHVPDEERDQKFTTEEIAILSTKFEEFLIKLSEQQDILESEIKDLRKVIDSINTNMPKYPKGVWLDTTLNKLTNWASRYEKVEKIANTMFKISKDLFS